MMAQVVSWFASRGATCSRWGQIEMLSPIRVLDLSDDRGMFCGFVLAELAAEGVFE